MSDQGASVRTKPEKPAPRPPGVVAAWPRVRAFIQSHPSLVHEDGELLDALGLTFSSANVVAFGPSALARQLEAYRRESSAREALEATARANFAAQTQCHAAVLDILDSRHPADLARRLDETARGRFGLAAAVLTVEGRAPGGWRALAPGFVDGVLGEDEPARLGRVDLDGLFPEAAGLIGSVALLRLRLWRTERPGLIVLGAADPETFAPDMGLELLGFLSRVVERTADRWPPL